MISGTAGRIEAHEVLLDTDFFVELWKTIRSRIGLLNLKILNFKVYMNLYERICMNVAKNCLHELVNTEGMYQLLLER